MKKTAISFVLLFAFAASAQFKPTGYDTNTDAVAQLLVRAQIGQQVGPLGSNFLAGVSFSTNEYSVKSFGAVGNGVTDDTTAIQNTINAAVSNSPYGGTIDFPDGEYVLSGSFQDVSGANAQLIIPQPPVYHSAGITIVLCGPRFPAQSQSIINADWTNHSTSIIRSTLTGTGGGSSMLATYRSASPNFANFTPVTIVIKNLNFRCVPNPQMSGLNFRQFFAAKTEGLVVDSSQAPFSISSVPTTTGSFGIMAPTNNNGAYTYFQDTSVVGFYNGYEVGEHTTGDNVSAWKCRNALVLPFGYHASHFDRFLTVHCPYGIVFTGNQRLVIDEYDVEHADSGWAANVEDVSDHTSLGSSDIKWAAVLANSGISHLFTAYGTNNWTREIGSGTITAGLNANPPSLPPDLPGYPLYASYDADSAITATTNLWFDQWTNHLNLTAPSAISVQANILNHHSILSCAGGTPGGYFSNILYSVVQPHEVMIVAKVAADFSHFGGLVDGTNSGGGRNALFYNQSTGAMGFLAGTEVDAGTIPTAKWIVFDAVFNGASSVIYTNGVQAVAGNVGSNPMKGLIVGELAGYNFGAIIDVARVDTWSTNLGSGAFSTQRSNVFWWVTNRYNISP